MSIGSNRQIEKSVRTPSSKFEIIKEIADTTIVSIQMRDAI
jgi:hypothetical protein